MHWYDPPMYIVLPVASLRWQLREMFVATDHAAAPWVVVRSDDKKRARLAIIRHILEQFDYDYKDHKAIGDIDPLILAGPDIWNG